MPSPTSDFFSTPLLNGLLAQVVQLVRFGDGLPIIYGEPGIGKSAVALEVSARLASDGAVVCIDCREFASDLTGFLTYALTELGYANGKVSSSGEGLSQLRNFSLLLLKNQQLAVLVLDNADVLDDMSLAALLSLAQGQEGSGAGLKFVFTGHAGLVDRVDQLDIVDVGVYDFELSSFSPIESEDFIAFIAQKKQLNFSKESAASLWSASKGNPSKILALIEQVPPSLNDAPAHLPKSYLLDLKKIPIWHAATICVLIIALAWVFVSKDESSRTVAVEIINLPQKTQNTTDEQKLTPNDSNQNLPEKIADLDPIVTLEPKAANPVMKPTLPDEATADINHAADLISSSNPPIGEPSQASDAIMTEPKPKPKPQTEIDVLLERSRAFIEKQSPSAYALQVLALSNQAAILQYIRRQPNQSALNIVKTKRNSGTLFIVVTGVYPTKEAALKAKNDLPLVQRQAKPWPKPYSVIQADIEQ